ncbi:EscU/YscU/HrcU family type III secretion system export apparatus switch protein [Chenggangzhangella methanolivorans]|uniref:EscU/YscU/HrcU family type III secretion system export apparatus switch protein n=1 Tax=Chenggangzhangella methanolivorans TaxID=1437009 RepID=A0A9E6RCZ4_9HYPH|nr:EscU/YscU/HrcU family type III secretion system export apparatus switch protein [Chenggangzhangella methanolivorans]QZN98476.1 EscU/YscU/HrcU family type III secretion system export apparatus switch protein [Chenggangzhangella methanolivorans]
MNDTSEEKSLPASRKKLDDARKKGQVNKSQDLVAAFALFAATLYVIAAYPGFLSRVSELMELTGQVYVQDFASLVPRVFGVVSAMMISVVAPLLAIVAGAAILANMVVMRGFVFSVEPIRPNFDNINPAKGLQRVFSMRSVVELLKSIVKVVALAGAFVAVFAIGLQALMQSPSCGMPCVYDTSVKLLQPIVITAIIVFFVVGAIDVLLQRQLFLRDMRMTKTEAKREFKDMEGDPMIRRERRKRSQELVGAGSVKVGVKNATLLIGRTGKGGGGLALRARRDAGAGGGVPRRGQAGQRADVGGEPARHPGRRRRPARRGDPQEGGDRRAGAGHGVPACRRPSRRRPADLSRRRPRPEIRGLERQPNGCSPVAARAMSRSAVRLRGLGSVR